MRTQVLFGAVSAITLAFATTTLAQPAPTPSPAAPDAGSVGEIVVTGSRIARRDFVSATPIITASQESLQASGNISIEASLNQLPQFTPAGGANNGGRGGGQRSTLNLRGLGDNRNLVLLDGRRLPNSSALGQVDVNIIPQPIVQAVETITGGASAVYGSDAMSGVVNFKTRTRFEGLQVDAQYGNSFKSDRQARDLTLTAGGGFAGDRGSAVLSVGYTDRERLHGNERRFYDRGTLSSFLGYGAYAPSASNLPTQAAVNAVFSRYGITGNVSRTNPIGFNDDASLFTVTGGLNYRGRTSGDYVIDAGNVRHPFAPTLDALSALERRTVFGKVSYDVAPKLTAYAQVLYVDSWTDQDDGTSLTQFGIPTIPVSNPFIPADLRTILASRPDPNAPFDFNGRYSGLPHKGWTDEYFTSQFVLGIRGAIPVKDWTFDIYASTDKTDHPQRQRNGILLSQVQSLFNAPDGGNALCKGGYNPFGDANATRLTPECINYITATIHNQEDIGQDIVEASIQGSLFALPAGDLRFSAVADHRKNTYDYTPDSQLRTPGQVQASNPALPTSGQTTVSEISGELLIPVLRDMAFAKSLNIGAAYRYSKYKLSGGASTFKADLDWTLVPGLLLRAGFARAIRAPNIGELFSAATGGQAGTGNPPASGEPCDVRTVSRIQGGAALRGLCIATGIPTSIVDSYIFPTTATASVTTGNRNLTPEKADTYTAGLVLRPDFSNPLLSNLSLSVDYYNIQISNVISVIPGATAINKCYNLDGSNPTYSAANAYCQLLHRDGNGQLSLVETPYLNLGGLKTDGVDVELDWRYSVGPGAMTVNSIVGYKRSYKQKQLPGSPFQDFAGTFYQPKWTALTTLGYEWGPAQLGIRFRYVDGMKDSTAVTRPASPAAGVKPYYTFDLIGAYQITPKVTVRGGVTNLFDTQPLVVAGTPGNTNAGVYDIIGRSYYVAVRARF